LNYRGVDLALGLKTGFEQFKPKAKSEHKMVTQNRNRIFQRDPRPTRAGV
jgi:hypothetical protein